MKALILSDAEERAIKSGARQIRVLMRDPPDWLNNFAKRLRSAPEAIHCLDLKAPYAPGDLVPCKEAGRIDVETGRIFIYKSDPGICRVRDLGADEDYHPAAHFIRRHFRENHATLGRPPLPPHRRPSAGEGFGDLGSGCAAVRGYVGRSHCVCRRRFA